jgi:CspA family cold shock protein
MAQGTIKTIRDDKGFGFITPDGGGQDLFFHSSALEYGAFDQLRVGQRVQFTAGADPRNPSRTRAEQVELVIE